MSAYNRAFGGVALGLLGLAPVWALAAPILSWPTLSAQPGQGLVMELRVTGGTETCSGVSGTILLPWGVEATNVWKGALLAHTTFALYQRRLESEEWRGLSFAAASGVTTFSTANGVLLRLGLRIAAETPPGEYALAFAAIPASSLANTAHSLASSDGLLSVPHGTTAGRLTIRMPPRPGDVNGNGIPDAWEVRYFGAVTNVSNTTDADADGLSDYNEWRSDTNPRDALSCLAIRGMDVIRHGPASAPVVKWYGMPGGAYEVLRATDMRDEFEAVSPELPTVTPMNVFTDSPTMSDGPWFYRVRMK